MTVCATTRAARRRARRNPERRAPATLSRAGSSAGIRITVPARSKTSAGLTATSAPAARSASHRPGVPFHTDSQPVRDDVDGVALAGAMPLVR